MRNSNRKIHMPRGRNTRDNQCVQCPGWIHEESFHKKTQTQTKQRLVEKDKKQLLVGTKQKSKIIRLWKRRETKERAPWTCLRRKSATRNTPASEEVWLDSRSELWPWLHSGFARAARFFLALLPYLDCSLFVSGFFCVFKEPVIICAVMLMKSFYKVKSVFRVEHKPSRETDLSSSPIIRERHMQRHGSSLLFFLLFFSV